MDMENILDEQLSSLDLSALEELMGAANSNGSLFGDTGLLEIIKSLIKGDAVFEWSDLLRNLLSLFFSQVESSLILMVEIVVLCILIGLMTNMSSSFGENTASKMGAMVTSCTVAALCIQNFLEIYQLCSSSIEIMATVMQVLLPIMIPLLIAMGNITSGGVLNPVILGAITMFSTLIQKVILPSIFLSCVFSLINSLSDKNYVKKLALFLRGFSIFLIGLAVTLFSGLTALQGLASKSADGMLIKTARFSIDNFVPIIGGFAADSIEMIMSCTGIIKNAIGIFGLLMVLTLLMVPLIKMIAIAFIYKAAAIVIEPIGNATVSDCLNEVGNTVITMAVVLFLTALLFLIFLTVLISIGSL